MDKDYADLIELMLRKETLILGPDVVIRKARLVPGLTMNNDGKVIDIKGNPQKILDNLVDEYKMLLGGMAIHFCKPSVQEYVKTHPKIELPEILKTH